MITLNLSREELELLVTMAKRYKTLARGWSAIGVVMSDRGRVIPPEPEALVRAEAEALVTKLESVAGPGPS